MVNPTFDAMNIFPSRSEFMELADKGNLVPVYADLMADFETPVSVYSKLNRNGPAYILESIEGGANLYRYSFIGCQPRKTFSVFWDKTTITERNGETKVVPTPADPLDIIEEEMSRYRPVRLPGMPRFMGGAVGYLAYEYIHAVEPSVPLAKKDPLKMPVLHFMVTDTIVIFDRARQTLRLLRNAHIEGGDREAAYDEAVEGIEALYQSLQEERSLTPIPLQDSGEITVPEGNMGQECFEEMVTRTKEYIRAGDAFQVVGSQRFERKFDQPPLDLYRALRTVNPSPYMFLYETEDFSLVGASPEVHVRLTDGLAETRPLAGTRPRGKTVEEDLAHERHLLADEKECAEHLMLVDLSRNDLGRVCDYGSVVVPEFMGIERYSHVMHIVSQVEGRMNADKNAYDLMRATFPAGTVSGAPKIRAMQIIEELEGEQRGPYAGAMVYFSYDGNLDSCIAIRTALVKKNRLFIQSGAGLVADSQPKTEYEESINKATGMLKAVKLAENIRPAKAYFGST